MEDISGTGGKETLNINVEGKIRDHHNVACGFEFIFCSADLKNSFRGKSSIFLT